MPPTDRLLTERQAPRRALAALVLVLLAAGGAYSVHLGGTLRFGDELGYTHVARNLVSRHWYSEDGRSTTAYRAPGYPFLLAALLALHAPIVLLRLTNFVALAAALCVAYALLRQNGFPRAGLIAAVLLAAYPVLFFTAGTLYPQTLGVLLLLLVLWLWTRPRRRGADAAAAGAAYGYLTLCIPGMLPMLPFFVVLLWALSRPGSGRGAALFLTVTLLVIAPWACRNFLVFHRFVPVSTNSGINLLLGNSENAGPNTGYTANISRYARQAQNMDEVSRDNYYREQAEGWMRAHPAQDARLYVLKAVNYFNFHNDIDTKTERSRANDLIMLATYGPLLLFAGLRFAAARAYPPTRLELCLAALYVINALVGAVFFTRIRFRLPFDAILICLDAIFLERLMRVSRQSAPERSRPS